MRYRLRTLLIVLALVSIACTYARLYLNGSYEEWPHPSAQTIAWRCYSTDFQAALFWPAAKVESILRGFPVSSLKYKNKPATSNGP
jgi:hypothetical protein